MELSKAGLSDQVLLALIEVDRSVFTIDAPTLKMLKDAGVSEAVIVAMIRSGRTAPPVSLDEQPIEPPPPFVAPEPQVVVIEHEVPVVREVPVAVPVYITAPLIGPRVRNAGDARDDDNRNRAGTQILRAIRGTGASAASFARMPTRRRTRVGDRGQPRHGSERIGAIHARFVSPQADHRHDRNTIGRPPRAGPRRDRDRRAPQARIAAGSVL